MFSFKYFLVFLCTGLISCSDLKDESLYIQEIKTWHQERITELTAEDGWTALAGLYWLNQDLNKIGSDTSNHILLPKGTPPFLGQIELRSDTVLFIPHEDISVNINEKLVQNPYILSPHESTQTVSWNSYQFFIITRGEKIGIRLRDTQHPNRQKLKTIPSYPIDPNWVVPAMVSYQDTSKTVMIQNVLGQNTPTKIAATLNFKLGDSMYSLYAIDGGPENYFVIFSDLTTGDETYGGGRYLYPAKAHDGSKTLLDFNKAHNPPCVFTPYATCPLPPKENNINFAIVAGEKYLDFIH